jgi:hypothetical protein
MAAADDEYSQWERDHTVGDPPPPSLTWTRYLDNGFAPHAEFQVSKAEGLRLAPLGYRMYRYIQQETAKGRLPVMNPFKKSNAGPRMGVPVGGFGSGTIGREKRERKRERERGEREGWRLIGSVGIFLSFLSPFLFFFVHTLCLCPPPPLLFFLTAVVREGLAWGLGAELPLPRLPQLQHRRHQLLLGMQSTQLHTIPSLSPSLLIGWVAFR